MSVYEENGYASRPDYLRGLAEEYGVPFKRVKVLAYILGEDEDFDGLVTTLEYYADWGE